ERAAGGPGARDRTPRAGHRAPVGRGGRADARRAEDHWRLCRMSQETSTPARLAAKKRALLAQLVKQRGIETPAADAIVRRPDRREEPPPLRPVPRGGELPLSFAQQ